MAPRPFRPFALTLTNLCTTDSFPPPLNMFQASPDRLGRAAGDPRIDPNPQVFSFDIAIIRG